MRVLSNLRPALVIAAVLWLVGVPAILAIRIPSTGADTGMVTDPEQGIEIPASKERDIQDMEGPANPAPEDPGIDHDPGDAAAPSAVTPTITPDTDSNGDPVAPLPNALLADPTNTYSSGDSSGSTDVYAGAEGDDPAVGLLIQVDTNYGTGDGNTSIATGISGDGALRLTSISGRTLGVRDGEGQTGTYDLDTHQITWEPACRGPNPCPVP